MEKSKLLLSGATIIALLFVCVLHSRATSFDCSKATTPAEKMVCSNDELSQLDDSLNLHYKKAISSSTNPDTLKSEQHVWIKKMRACKDVACLKEAYNSRLSELNSHPDTLTATATGKQQLRLKLKQLPVKHNGYYVPENVDCKKVNSTTITELNENGFKIESVGFSDEYFTNSNCTSDTCGYDFSHNGNNYEMETITNKGNIYHIEGVSDTGMGGPLRHRDTFKLAITIESETSFSITKVEGGSDEITKQRYHYCEGR